MPAKATRGSKADKKSPEQVTAHVSEKERKEVEAYAEQFGLDAGNVLHLLWRRELRVGKPLDLNAHGQGPGRETGDMRKSKVTVHNVPRQMKASIRKHCAKQGVSMSHGSSTLLRDEMDKRWLERRLDDDSD